MNPDPAAPDAVAPPDPPPRPALRLGPAAVAGLGLVLAALAVYAGLPALDAPWIQGDEYVFIASNPDVTGEGRDEPTLTRWLGIFDHAHEDLYQPITILSYAIEWSLWGEQRVRMIRLTDVLLHALNALLLWGVLAALLRRLSTLERTEASLIGWALTAIWTFHPMLVTAYAADMGRTHLLAATFCFLSLRMHLRSLEPGRGAWFWGALAALLVAMLNKPMVGWVVLIAGLEWALIGPRRMFRAPRVYVIAVVCGFFAVLTVQTTRDVLMLEDSPLPIFGDPVSRAALGLWFYLRHLLVPVNLSTWYPPAVDTSWSNPRVWVGVVAFLASAAFCVWAALARRGLAAAAGLAWFWGMWLPVSGLVGARVVAAQDRYLYQPMIGLLLVLGAGVAAVLRARPAAQRPGAAWIGVAIAALLMAVALPGNRDFTEHARSTVQRALHAAEQNPGDPRVLEFLAAAYDFAWTHVTPESRAAEAAGEPPIDWLELMHDTLIRASDAAEANPHYFADAYNRAAFHRRLSFAQWKIGDAQRSLTEAQRAANFEPDAYLTHLRFAHAFRALGAYPQCAAAYAKMEETMPDDAPQRGLRLVEFGDLLLWRFRDYASAMERFRAALRLPKLPADAHRLATLGLARCEIMVGQGETGYRLASTVMNRDPLDLDAKLVVALYHLRSHHFAEAGPLYEQVLDELPTDYEALRGYHELCAQLNAWGRAAGRWQAAMQAEPDHPAFAPYFVWAAACAGEPAVEPLAVEITEKYPQVPFAWLARMLYALRRGEVAESIEFVRRAAEGTSIPDAFELPRAEITLRIFFENGRLPPESLLIRAEIRRLLGDADTPRELAQTYLSEHAGRGFDALAQTLRVAVPPTSAPSTAPATAPAPPATAPAGP